MKIRIYKDGTLGIGRKGMLPFNLVCCPYSRDHKIDEEKKWGNGEYKTSYAQRPCGTWCALFGEPEYHKEHETENGSIKLKELVYLSLCNEKWYEVSPDDFEDLRG